MPYIAKDRREVVNPLSYDTVMPINAGELNYVLTVYLKHYFENQGGRYQQINDIMGALEGAKMEFYRRVAAPYEDTKIKENGDVY